MKWYGCESISPFQHLNQAIYFHETSYERNATGAHPTAELFNFLLSAETTRQTGNLVMS
jgi:hypothetical protein